MSHDKGNFPAHIELANASGTTLRSDDIARKFSRLNWYRQARNKSKNGNQRVFIGSVH